MSRTNNETMKTRTIVFLESEYGVDTFGPYDGEQIERLTAAAVEATAEDGITRRVGVIVEPDLMDDGE